MDPNANLAEQQSLLLSGTPDRGRMLNLRSALQSWRSRGGFDPRWTDYPHAAARFRAWQRRNGLIERGLIPTRTKA